MCATGALRDTAIEQTSPEPVFMSDRARRQSTLRHPPTDPETLGWMHGFPPSPDRTITFQNGSFRKLPPNCAGPGATSASWCRP